MKMNVTKEQFVWMYNNLTLDEMCKELNTSKYIITKCAKQEGLVKKMGRPFKKYEFED